MRRWAGPACQDPSCSSPDLGKTRSASASTLHKHTKILRGYKVQAEAAYIILKLLMCLYEQAGWPTCRGIEWFLEKSGSWKILA